LRAAPLHPVGIPAEGQDSLKPLVKLQQEALSVLVHEWIKDLETTGFNIDNYQQPGFLRCTDYQSFKALHGPSDSKACNKI
jgi:hypothetical protein